MKRKMLIENCVCFHLICFNYNFRLIFSTKIGNAVKFAIVDCLSQMHFRIKHQVKDREMWSVYIKLSIHIISRFLHCVSHCKKSTLRTNLFTLKFSF